MSSCGKNKKNQLLNKQKKLLTQRVKDKLMAKKPTQKTSSPINGNDELAHRREMLRARNKRNREAQRQSKTPVKKTTTTPDNNAGKD